MTIHIPWIIVVLVVVYNLIRIRNERNAANTDLEDEIEYNKAILDELYKTEVELKLHRYALDLCARTHYAKEYVDSMVTMFLAQAEMKSKCASGKCKVGL